MTKLAIFWTFFAAACVSFLSAAGGEVRAASHPIFVHEITSVAITLEKSNPPNVLVEAKGVVMTGGHTNPRLVKVLYAIPPADGFQDLYFFIDPPPLGTAVTEVVTPVSSPSLNIGARPTWMKGIRVWSATNKIEKPCC